MPPSPCAVLPALTRGRFLEHFHPYVPVLRKRDPDECHQANPTLFWTIIYIASRRYARDEYTFNALVEKLNRDIWTLLATPNLDLEAIHAIMLICAWPFPTIRFVTDPSITLINVALSACMLLGLHDGIGSHSKFLVGGRINFHSTDLEASVTWISCCILAQRYPPFFSCYEHIAEMISGSQRIVVSRPLFYNTMTNVYEPPKTHSRPN
jgi:transcriptional regulatory protein LEU3